MLTFALSEHCASARSHCNRAETFGALEDERFAYLTECHRASAC